MNKFSVIAVLSVFLNGCSGSDNTVSGIADTVPHVSMDCVNTHRYNFSPICMAGEMYFDSLMTIHGYDFIIELPTRGAKIYMDSIFCDNNLDEVMWMDSSRVVFANSGPMEFTEWKKRGEIPVERSDRKVYVDSFIDTEGVKRIDRCDVAYRRNVTRIYYLNVREANRHKMDSLFDRIEFITDRHSGSGSIGSGRRAACNL